MKITLIVHREPSSTVTCWGMTSLLNPRKLDHRSWLLHFCSESSLLARPVNGRYVRIASVYLWGRGKRGDKKEKEVYYLQILCVIANTMYYLQMYVQSCKRNPWNLHRITGAVSIICICETNMYNCDPLIVDVRQNENSNHVLKTNGYVSVEECPSLHYVTSRNSIISTNMHTGNNILVENWKYIWLTHLMSWYLQFSVWYPYKRLAYRSPHF